MENIEVNKKNINELFAKSNYYNVPYYQRPYSWSTNQVQTLLEDIKEAIDNKNKEYFLGSLVLQEKETKRTYDILDGQQRLTTIILILSTLKTIYEEKLINREISRKEKEDIEHSISEVRLLIYDKEHRDKPRKGRIEFSSQNNSKIFMDNLYYNNHDTLTTESMSKSSKNMLNSINVTKKFFKSLCINSNESNIDYILNYHEFLTQSTVLISISTSNVDDAFKIFDTLNTRGLNLTHADIIKADFLKEINKDEIEEYTKEWEKIENELSNGEIKWVYINKKMGKEFESFLQVFRIGKRKTPPKSSLKNEFDEIYLKDKKDGKEKIKEIKIYYEDYKKIYNANSNYTNNQIKNLLFLLDKSFHTDIWHAILIEIYRKTNKNFNSDFISFLEKLENKISYEYILSISNSNRQKTIYNILKEIENQNNLNNILSNNEIFNIEWKKIDSIIKEDLYKENKISNIGNYILYKLNYIYEEKLNYNFFNVSKKSIEHILPQNPSEKSNWNKNFSKEEKKEFTHKIGNLIFVSSDKNRELSNSDYKIKRDKYYKNISNFPHTAKIFAKYDNWGIKELKHNNEECINYLKHHYEKNCN